MPDQLKESAEEQERRKQFERWCREFELSTERNLSGHYAFTNTDGAWRGWNAAVEALTPPSSSEGATLGNKCEGCGEPVYLTRGFGYSHVDSTLNVDCDARPNPSHESAPKSFPLSPREASRWNKQKMAEELALAAMSIFIPESNMDEDDPGGQHSYNQAVKRFKEIL